MISSYRDRERQRWPNAKRFKGMVARLDRRREGDQYEDFIAVGGGTRAD